MFFKKKVNIEDYCSWTLIPLFSKDREAEWEATRRSCDDPFLNAVDQTLYFANIRAIIIELMLIAVTKNFSIDLSADARVFVMQYFNRHNLHEIDLLCGDYNRAFGTPGGDGVEQMVLLFSDKLTESRMKEATIKRFLGEFYGILRGLFNEYKSIKLVSA
jgi:hypothetical protein